MKPEQHGRFAIYLWSGGMARGSSKSFMVPKAIPNDNEALSWYTEDIS